MDNVNNYYRFDIVILTSLLAVVLVRTAWVCDDAYITMRTVDNFVNGFGLVFNLGERVQSFTHPLWLFLVSGLYAITHDAYYSLILISITMTLAAAVILIKKIAKNQSLAILGITILLFSKSFIDYSTSGLENSLSYFLIVVVLGVYLTMTTSLKKLFFTSFLAALGALNRLDLLIILLPAMLLTLLEVWKSMKNQRRKVLLVCLLGFSPLLAWLIFSLSYYGFLFPNTAYAKLNTGIPQNQIFHQGIGYFLSLFNLDPLTLLVILWGLAESVISRNNHKITISIGIVFYLGYIGYIGGDFMNGRFFTVPLLCAVILLCRSEIVKDWKSLVIPVGLVLFVGLTSPYPPIFSTVDYGKNQNTIIDSRGVADERAYYYPTTGLLHTCQDCQLPNHQWVKDGLIARDNGSQIEINKAIGFFGFYAGPKKYIIDIYALSNPLLARLPISDMKEWRIGHFERSLPSGYQETLESGVNQITDPDLAEFYDHLSLITQGDLFSTQRVVTIWKMNTGQYDYLLSHVRNP